VGTGLVSRLLEPINLMREDPEESEGGSSFFMVDFWYMRGHYLNTFNLILHPRLH